MIREGELGDSHNPRKERVSRWRSGTMSNAVERLSRIKTGKCPLCVCRKQYGFYFYLFIRQYLLRAYYGRYSF